MEVTTEAATIAALLSTAAISLLPNVLLFTFPEFLSSQSTVANNILALGEALAAGALLGDVFLHTIPHAIVELDDMHELDSIGIHVLLGFATFFAMDQWIRTTQGRHQHHHHNDHTVQEHACTPQSKDTRFSSNVLLNLTADSLHNFTDGLAIGASFAAHALSSLSSPSSTHIHPPSTRISQVLYMLQKRGGIVSLSVMFHEIPHELGDFSILIMNGMTKKQAILTQFTTAIAAFMGTIVGLLPILIPGYAWETLQHLMLPFTAGGFLYLAAVNILPELMDYNTTLVDNKRFWIMLQLVFFTCGISFMYLVADMEEHDHHGSHHHHDHHHHHEL